jgi:predicted metal-dependent phosphoesterase TrpH
MILRFESHTHTNFSDGNFYKLMIRTALKKKIDVIAITDHNTMKGYDYCVRYAKECAKRDCGDIFILPAEEVGCDEGDVLAYGISEEIPRGHVAETIDNIHDQAALAVMPHPFALASAVSMKTAKTNNFDGIEIINFNSFDLYNHIAQAYAKARPDLIRMGGMDAHQPWDLGHVLNIIDADPETDSILKALRSKKIRVVQSPSSFPWRVHYTVQGFFDHFLTYLRCGLKYQMRWFWKRKPRKISMREYKL